MSSNTDRVFPVPKVQEEIARWHPRDQAIVSGVLAHLEDNAFRNNNKEDLGFNSEPDGGPPVWGIWDRGFFVAFVEEVDDDSTITVVHVSRLSRFGSHRWSPWIS